MAEANPAGPSAGATPPPPSTFVGRMRARLPGRGWMIFFGITGTIIALNRRDTHMTSLVRAELVEKAEEKANQPWGVAQRHPRYFVCLAPPPGHNSSRKVRFMFKEFVKPIFDAAAMDYEVIEAASPGALKNEIRRRVYQAKEEIGAPDADPATGLRVPKALENGIIAIGRTSWREVLEGLNEGCLSSRPDETAAAEGADVEKEITGLVDSRDDDEDIARKRRLADEKLKKEQPLELSDANLPHSLALPPVGFVPYRNVLGWWNLPKRFASFFTDYVDARLMGDQALKIALEQRRPFLPGVDERAGLDEDIGFESKGGGKTVNVHESVWSKLEVFDEPKY